jgi:hypothetical protein
VPPPSEGIRSAHRKIRGRRPPSPTPCSTACSRRCTASSSMESPYDVPLLPPTARRPPMPPSLVANPPRSAHEGHGTPIAPNTSFCVAPGGHEPRWPDPDTRLWFWANASATTTSHGRADHDRLPARDHQGGERQGIARTCRRPLCGLRPPVRRTCTKTSELCTDSSECSPDLYGSPAPSRKGGPESGHPQPDWRSGYRRQMRTGSQDVQTREQFVPRTGFMP